MDKYEILYIIRGAIEDELKEKTVQKFEQLVAYEIDHQTEGYYVLMNVTCTKEAQAEIYRLMRNDENVIRQMFLKK